MPLKVECMYFCMLGHSKPTDGFKMILKKPVSRSYAIDIELLVIASLFSCECGHFTCEIGKAHHEVGIFT